MKKLILALLILLFSTTVFAKDKVNSKEFLFNDIGINIKFCEDKKCILVKTMTGPEYRIYSCGKLDKHIWKELNENEETIESIFQSIYSTDTNNKELD